MNDYTNQLLEALKLQEENEQLICASEIIAEAARQKRLTHYFGTDMQAAGLISDIFFRSGTLTSLDPMLDPTLDPAHGAYRNAMALQVDNLAPCILDYYERVMKGDPVLLVGSAEDLVFQQALQWAKEKELRIIAVVCRGQKAEADAVLELGCRADQPELYTASASAMLNLLLETIRGELSDAKYFWTGIRGVNLEQNMEKIDEFLFQIRHL